MECSLQHYFVKSIAAFGIGLAFQTSFRAFTIYFLKTGGFVKGILVK